MAQRKSLSGRSPFCQLKQVKSRKFTGKVFSRRAGECSLFLGRLDQGLVGNAESTHVNRPKGKATLVP